MRRVCAQSGTPFTILPTDEAFAARLGVPLPTLCPEERRRRRLAFRNERNLYQRKCDRSGAGVISLYAPECPWKVFSSAAWWGEGWDARDYGREIDWNRPFFEQFRDLHRQVPLLALYVVQSENCEYNNFCVGSKDCYMSLRVGSSEGILYSYLVIDCRDCVDCYNISRCELCYEVVDGEGCYGVRHSQIVSACHHSSFLFQCRSCTNCLMCANLRGKEFYVRNVHVGETRYREIAAAVEDAQGETHDALLREFQELKGASAVPCYVGNKNENVTGNYIFESRDVTEGFDVRGGDDVGYCWGHIFGKNCRDSDFTYYLDNGYETVMTTHSNELRWTVGMFEGCHFIDYSMNCVNGSHHLIGCAGLKHGSYSILNREYSPADYEVVRRRLIAHMERTGEWGEFFPPSLSPFAYNETVAGEYLPLSREEVLRRGLSWREDDPQPAAAVDLPPEELPGDIDSLLGHAYRCATCSRAFRFQSKELQWYAQQRTPLPRSCQNCRYARRVRGRSPRKLLAGSCASCGADFLSSHPPSPQVMCLDCYEGSVA